MSYILEALKKSEQERKRGELPEITHFESGSSGPDSSKKYWPIVVGVLVVLNLGLVFLWSPWQSNSDVNLQVDTGEVSQPKTGTKRSAEEAESSKFNSDQLTHKLSKEISDPKLTREKVAPAPSAKPVASTPRHVQQAQPVAEPELITPSKNLEPMERKPQVNTSYLPQLQELPADILGQIPDMSFSSHMYSSSARFRSIIINGRRLKEGQFLDGDIQVVEITEKGVVLSFDGTIFEVDVLGQWVN